MGAIDVLFQQQQAKKQDWQNVGQGLSGLGQSAKEIAGTTKIQKYKKAGQMLFKLGGPTERNLQMVVKMFDLAPEEAKELIVTYQTFETFKNNKKLDDPASPEVLRAFGERRGVQPEEGATTRDLLGLSKLFLEKKGKEWGSQLTVPVGEEGGGKFISDKPGTEIPSDFTVPSLAGKGAGRAIKTWITADGKVINIPNNESPPPGAVPYSTGMDIDVGPEGTSIRTGVSRGRGEQRKTTTDIEGKLFNVQEGIARLDEIANSYDPQFLQIGTKTENLWTGWKEKLADTPVKNWMDLGVSDEERKALEEFSAFRREALSNINQHIQERTGAQMSKDEAKRLRKEMPDSGEGVFDGDSPTQFEGKWKSTIKSLKASQARYIYYLKNGFTPEQIAKMAETDSLMSLQDINRKINKRGGELKKEGLTPAQIKIKLLQEFFSMD